MNDDDILERIGVLELKMHGMNRELNRLRMEFHNNRDYGQPTNQNGGTNAPPNSRSHSAPTFFNACQADDDMPREYPHN